MKRRALWLVGLVTALLVLAVARSIYTQVRAADDPAWLAAGAACQAPGGGGADSCGPTPPIVTVIVTGGPGPWPPPPACATPLPPHFQPTPSPPPEPEYTISGTVFDPGGAPLPGVQVYTEPPSSYWTSGETDAEGRYTLLAHAGTYQITAARRYPSPRPLTAPHRVVTVPPSQGDVDLVLPASYGLGGTVRDHAGAPLAGVSVRAEPIGVNTGTQGDGAYALELPAGNYCVSAGLKGRNSAPPPRAVRLPPAQPDVDFHFLQDYLVGGVVYDWDGTPLAQAVVTARAEGLGSADAGTSPDGHYSVRLITGTYSLDAWEAHHAYRAQAPAGVPPDQPDTDLTFGPAYSVSGTVRDSGGTPLPMAVVSVCPFQGGDECATDLTDAQGQYRVWVLEGQWQVRAYYPDLLSPPEQVVEVPPDQVVDFTFPPPGSSAAATAENTISGTVHDGQGDPVPGAGLWAFTHECGTGGRACTSASGTYTITLERSGSYLVWDGAEHRLVSVPPAASGIDFLQYAIQGTVRDESGQIVPGARMQADVGGETVTAWTDLGGGYMLHVPAGTHQVTAWHAEYASPPPQTVDVPPDRAGLDWTMPAQYVLSGVVRDTDGNPLKEAEVQAEGPAGQASADSDACGIYWLWVPAGPYTVTVRLEGYASPPPQAVSVPPDVHDADFVLAEAWYTIAGTVRDEGGSPVEGATVCADKMSCAAADAAGAYQLSVPDGTYSVWVHRDGYAEPPAQSVSVPPDQAGVDFTLQFLYTVSGTVRDGAGQPLPSAEVQATDALCGTAAMLKCTDPPAGVYTLTLTAGTYEISARAEGYASDERLRVTVPPSAAGADLAVALPARYQVSGSVLDAGGAPVRARVEASGCGSVGGSAETKLGAYSLWLAAGTYTLRAEAHAAGYGALEVEVTVDGDLSGVDLTLPSNCCDVYGAATGPAGLALAGARVEVVDGPASGSATTGMCGAYRLSLAEPGTYTLRARRMGFGDVSQAVAVTPGAALANWNLAPLPGGTWEITGTVRDEGGLPAPFVAVQLTGLDVYAEIAAKADAQGRYAFAVPPGRYRVETSRGCYTDRPAQEVSVPPGAAVDLTFQHRCTNYVEGSVNDEAGRPIYGAELSAEGEGGSASASSDSQGAYRLYLSPGAWTVSLAQPVLCSYLQPPPHQVTVPPDLSGIDFRLVAPGRRLLLPVVLVGWP
jgi:protocatechuate 3,4-dioxygenase beta subunit